MNDMKINGSSKRKWIAAATLAGLAAVAIVASIGVSAPPAQAATAQKRCYQVEHCNRRGQCHTFVTDDYAAVNAHRGHGDCVQDLGYCNPQS